MEVGRMVGGEPLEGGGVVDDEGGGDAGLM